MQLTPETNLYAKISEINYGIQALNKEIKTVNPFKMHWYGVKAIGGGKWEHRWGNWIEKQDEKKLHLVHSRRAEALHRMQMYFIANTDW